MRYIPAIVVVLIISFCSTRGYSQSQEITFRYSVQFADKKNNPFSEYHPAAFLSPRALERRERMQIVTDSTDFPVTPLYLKTIVDLGCQVTVVSKWLNAIVIQVVDTGIVNTVRQLPFVNEVKLVARYAQTPITSVRRPFQLGSQTSHVQTEASYGLAYRQIEMLNGIGLHRKGLNGTGVVIAVFDAGFRNADAHPGLKHLFTSNRILATRSFVSPGSSVFNNSNHGTQCLSVIANYAPMQMTGTAPGASFVLCHTEDADTEQLIEEFFWAAAAEYADSIGADVISSSVGYSTFDDSTQNHSYADLNGVTTPAALAATIAAQKGLVVCNSAGNLGNNAWYYISTPADAIGILAVGAVDADEEATDFSSHGYSVDGRVKPDVMAMGYRTIVANPSNMDYQMANGTSFACPAIAGMAACLLQAHNVHGEDIVEAIKRSGDRFLSPDPQYGYGIPDFQLADLLLSNVALTDVTESSPLLFPNPFESSVSVVHYSNISETARVEIIDMVGRVKKISDYHLQQGYNQLVSDFSLFPSGLYIIRVVTETKSHELKAFHR